MRYVYSIIRFVPDPARDERVNVGLIVGSDDAPEWSLRLINNPKRARALDDRSVLPALWSAVNDIQRELDDYAAALEGAHEPRTDISETWLNTLWETHHNVVQFSRPAPIVAEDAEHALEVLFAQLIVDSESKSVPAANKTSAVVAARKAYALEGIRKGVNLAERQTVRGANYTPLFDFVVFNGRAVQLTQAWSFQRPDQEQLAEDVLAWAWRVKDIRNGGGTVELTNAATIEVPHTVDIAAIFTPPPEIGPHKVFREAMSAFQEIRIEAVPIDDSGRIGKRAHELLVKAGVQLPLDQEDRSPFN